MISTRLANPTCKRLVYHLAEPTEWEAAQGKESYTPSNYERDGFIHLSEPHQVADTSSKVFPGRHDLVLLTIDETRLTSELVREPANPQSPPADQPLFPHLYGPLNLYAVVASRVYSSGQQP